MRRRLLAITVAATALVVIAFAVPLAALVRSVARDRAVTEAERDMAALAPVLALTGDPALLEAAIERTPTGDDGRLTIWLADGTQLGDRTVAGEGALDLARTRQVAFSRRAGGELELYAPVITGEGDVSVLRARLPDSLLERGVVKAQAALGGVAVALVVAAAFVADRLGRSLTRDADTLAHTARALAGGDPTARAAPGPTPELAEAARALNLLAGRIDELRAAERERVADLSHRLRTPLTALRLDAEASGDPDLVTDVDRLEAAVTDLVHAARRPLHASSVAACDLAAVVRERAEHWSALADDDGRSWELDLRVARPVRVGLSHDEAAAAIDALIGNVFAHTSDGVAYAIRLALDGTTAQLHIDDAGPGLADPGTMLMRGTTSAHSSGLGLDIARRAAEHARGRLHIGTSSLGGARVTLEIPVAP